MNILSDEEICNLKEGKEVFLSIPVTPKHDKKKSYYMDIRSWIRDNVLYIETKKEPSHSPYTAKFKLKEGSEEEITQKLRNYRATLEALYGVIISTNQTERQVQPNIKHTSNNPPISPQDEGCSTFPSSHQLPVPQNTSSIPIIEHSQHNHSDKDPIDFHLPQTQAGTNATSQIFGNGNNGGNEIGRNSDIFKNPPQHIPQYQDPFNPFGSSEINIPNPFSSHSSGKVDGIDDIDVTSGLPDGTRLGNMVVGRQDLNNGRFNPAIPPGARFDPFGPQKRSQFGPPGGLPPL